MDKWKNSLNKNPAEDFLSLWLLILSAKDRKDGGEVSFI